MINKADLVIFNNIFQSELFGRSYPSKAKRMLRLFDEGYVELEEYVVPGSVPMRGWILTDKGRDALGEEWGKEKALTAK